MWKKYILKHLEKAKQGGLFWKLTLVIPDCTEGGVSGEEANNGLKEFCNSDGIKKRMKVPPYLGLWNWDEQFECGMEAKEEKRERFWVSDNFRDE